VRSSNERTRDVTDSTAVLDAPPPDDAALSRAQQEGRDAATRDPASPNPYRGQAGLFRAWMQGFFEAGPDLASLPLRQVSTPAPTQAPLHANAPAGVVAPVAPMPVGHIRPPPVIQVDQPAFTVRYPSLLNAALVPAGALAAMEASWTRFTYPSRKLEIACVPGAIIVDEGLAFDSDLRVIEQTTPTFSEAEIVACRRRIEAARQAGRLNTHAGAGVLCKRRSSFNYGHWLVEMFPYALLARELLPGQRLNPIVDRTTPRMLDVIYRSLYQLGVGLDQIVIAGPEPQSVETLFVLDGMSEHGSYLSPLAVAALERLALTVEPGPRRRLFVRRDGVEQRRLANQDAVAARFAAAGYDVIDPGAMSLTEQIVAFRAAERVVGVMGAAMANIAFCEPGTPITLLAHAHMPDTFFWFIANIKRHPYTEIRLAPVAPEDPQSWRGDFAMTDADIEAALTT
jgi:capsular polysaccharide biosynthesis protein